MSLGRHLVTVRQGALQPEGGRAGFGGGIQGQDIGHLVVHFFKWVAADAEVGDCSQKWLMAARSRQRGIGGRLCKKVAP